MFIANVYTSLGKRQIAWIGVPPEDLAPHTYSDADFAGCIKTLRSTLGIQLQIEGPHSCFPLQARSCRQTCVSFSTPEAEVVSIQSYGAFVKIAPGKEGLLHISELKSTRVEKVEDVLKIGEKIKVKLVKIDDNNRLNFSIKALEEKQHS